MVLLSTILMILTLCTKYGTLHPEIVKRLKQGYLSEDELNKESLRYGW